MDRGGVVGYDWVVITGTLPGVCYADGVRGSFMSTGFHFRLPTVCDRRFGIRCATARHHWQPRREGTFEHIGKAHIRKEVLRAVLEQQGDRPGLAHLISAMEPCDAYKISHDKQTHKTLIRPDSGKCCTTFSTSPMPVRADPPAGPDIGTVRPAILLQRRQLAGARQLTANSIG